VECQAPATHRECLGDGKMTEKSGDSVHRVVGTRVLLLPCCLHRLPAYGTAGMSQPIVMHTTGMGPHAAGLSVGVRGQLQGILLESTELHGLFYLNPCVWSCYFSARGDNPNLYVLGSVCGQVWVLVLMNLSGISIAWANVGTCVGCVS
jgi:hypothetical protein